MEECNVWRFKPKLERAVAVGVDIYNRKLKELKVPGGRMKLGCQRLC